jgi:hypothetical protein
MSDFVERLEKAVDPSVIQFFRDHANVDEPTIDPSRHIEDSQSVASGFRRNVLESPDVVAALREGPGGYHAKATYGTPDGTVMIKPYHSSAKNRHGWAEYVSKKLYDAANLQHLRGEVGVGEYQGVAVTIHPFDHDAMDYRIHLTGNRGEPIGTADSDPKDFMKIAVMDCLTDNRDRHRGNVLMKMHGGKYQPFAIDHGVAFKSGFTPTEHVEPMLDSSWRGSALSDPWSFGSAYVGAHSPSNLMAMQNWWNINKHAIAAEFGKHAGSIADPVVRGNVISDFGHRFGHIDECMKAIDNGYNPFTGKGPAPLKKSMQQDDLDTMVSVTPIREYTAAWKPYVESTKGLTQQIHEHVLDLPNEVPSNKNNRVRGIEEKTIYDLPGGRTMLKSWHAGHENQNGGWSEMAANGLAHAMGIGHLIAPVGVIEHKGVPMTVHPFHPNVSVIANRKWDPARFNHSDLLKLMIFDHMIDNTDRHGHNLLTYDNPDGRHGVLAIDHSYTLPTIPEDYDATLQSYVRSATAKPFIIVKDIRDRPHYIEIPGDEKAVLKGISDWWALHKDKMLVELEKHLQHLPITEHRDSIRKWVTERANTLTRHFDEYNRGIAPNPFERDTNETMEKSIHEPHWARIRNATTHEFHRLTDPQNAIDSTNHITKDFEDDVLLSNEEHKDNRYDMGIGGVFAKNVFKTPHGTVMIKPYHSNQYGGSPWDGWAVHTACSLFNAAGIGHLCDKVGVTKYKGVPVTVHPFEPNTQLARDVGDGNVHLDVADLAKISVMDFLSGNPDRHYGNLLVKSNPDGSHTPVAIDNGMAFVYKQFHSGYDNKSDSLMSYFEHPRVAISQFHNFDDMADKKADITKWWADHKDDVMKKFVEHTNDITSPDLKERLTHNFTERHNAITRAMEQWASDTSDPDGVGIQATNPFYEPGVTAVPTKPVPLFYDDRAAVQDKRIMDPEMLIERMRKDRERMRGIEPRTGSDSKFGPDATTEPMTENLKKSRQDLLLPKLTTKWTRPDAEIHQVNYYREIPLLAQKFRNLYSSLSKQERDRKAADAEKGLTEDFGAARRDQHGAAQSLGEFYGTNINPKDLGSYGMVYQNQEGRPLGYSVGEAHSTEHPSTTAHEGIHWLIDKVARDMPRPEGKSHISDDQIIDNIYNHLNDAIEPVARNFITLSHGVTRSSGDQKKHREFVTDVHTYLHSPVRRMYIRAHMGIPDSEWRKIDQSLKRSWDNIVQRGRELTPEIALGLTDEKK